MCAVQFGVARVLALLVDGSALSKERPCMPTRPSLVHYDCDCGAGCVVWSLCGLRGYQDHAAPVWRLYESASNTKKEIVSHRAKDSSVKRGETASGCCPAGPPSVSTNASLVPVAMMSATSIILSSSPSSFWPSTPSRWTRSGPNRGVVTGPIPKLIGAAGRDHELKLRKRSLF